MHRSDLDDPEAKNVAKTACDGATTEEHEGGTTPSSTGVPRIACVDLTSFGLQYFERKQEVSPDTPHLLIDAHANTPRIVALNTAAQARNLRIGMRLQEAQSLCPEAHVNTQDEEAIQDALRTICARLESFSPWVERHPKWPHTLWLRGDGLSSLWSSATQWGRDIHSTLMLQGWRSTVVVGFSRFFALAIARQYPADLRVLTTPDQERARALCTALSLLITDPKLCDEFETLGLRTLKDLYQLPPSAVHRRYGKEAAQWIQWVKYQNSLHSRAITPPKEYKTQVAWDHAVSQQSTLLFLLQKPLHALFLKIQRDGYHCQTLHFDFSLDWGKLIDDALNQKIQKLGIAPHGSYAFSLQAAFAHLDEVRWTELLRLRLSRVTFPLGVVSVHIEAEATHQETRQEAWADAGSPQVPDALSEALSQVRAALGDHAVGHLELQEAHLPEVRNHWKKLHQLKVPNPHPLWTPQALRRIHPRAHPLPAQINEDALATWFQAQNQPLEALHGPYIISGGWWQKQVERAYYYAVLAGGETLWLYYDRARAQWMWQGNIF